MKPAPERWRAAAPVGLLRAGLRAGLRAAGPGGHRHRRAAAALVQRTDHRVRPADRGDGLGADGPAARGAADARPALQAAGRGAAARSPPR